MHGVIECESQYTSVYFHSCSYRNSIAGTYSVRIASGKGYSVETILLTMQSCQLVSTNNAKEVLLSAWVFDYMNTYFGNTIIRVQWKRCCKFYLRGEDFPWNTRLSVTHFRTQAYPPVIRHLHYGKPSIMQSKIAGKNGNNRPLSVMM